MMVRTSRTVYLVSAWLFVIGVLVQVFFAGLVVVARQVGWAPHTTLGHLLALPLLVMLISMYLGKLPGSLKRGTWLLFVVYLLQSDILIFLRGSIPYLAALHPVLALIDFGLGFSLARGVQPIVGDVPKPLDVEPEPGPSIER